MAKTYPAEIRQDTISNAERKVFDLLKLQLPADWLVFHSVGIATHNTKPWAEIDFVVVGPDGVFCLEVKGGRIEREGGQYKFTDRHGNVSVKSQGPFEQVGPAAAKLYNFLKAEDAGLRNVPVGYGVVTPDITWKVTGPDIVRELVFDETDLRLPVINYFRRIGAYWNNRLGWGKDVGQVDSLTREKIKNLIRGDFDLRPSLKGRVDGAKAELIRLTEEQYRVLDDLEENPRVVIKGGAGSGKTLLALEEARRRGGSERVLLVCFNHQLGRVLRTAVNDLPNVTAGTLHSFMAATIERSGFTARLPAATKSDLFRNFFPDLCQEALIELDEIQTYDVLVVDEAQDLLLESYMEVFSAVLKGGISDGNWRFFLDSNQNLYGSVAPDALAQLNNAGPARYSLSVNCRNTSPIGVMTAVLSGVKLANTLRVSGPQVESHWYSDKRDLRVKVANALKRILGQKVPPGEIVILGSNRLVNSGIGEGLPGVPFPVSDEHGAKRSIRYSTISSFKGLESDYVLIVDIDDLASPEALLDIYVAASRACACLELFIHSNIREEYDQRAEEFGRALTGEYT